MNEYLSTAALFNRGANRKMIEALSALESEVLEADRGSYYGSIHGLVNHIVGGEFYILKLIKAAVPSNEALAIPELEVEMKPGVAPFPVYETAVKALVALDEAYVKLAACDDPGLLGTEVAVFGKTRKVGSLLVSASSHATHHRGQVSQVLDELKVENDFFTAFREL